MKTFPNFAIFQERELPPCLAGGAMAYIGNALHHAIIGPWSLDKSLCRIVSNFHPAAGPLLDLLAKVLMNLVDLVTGRNIAGVTQLDDGVRGMNGKT
jgi:hypothetical protein